MFNLDTVPRIVVKETRLNDVTVSIDPRFPNTYVLRNKESQWMTWDTHSNLQIKELYSSFDMAYGNVLISGFGFGILASWIASKPEVTSVKVLEVSQDVVNIFLSNNDLNKKITIEIIDASKYVSDEHFDCVFLDHFELEPKEEVFSKVQKFVTNVPNHDLLWFWSLEGKYLKSLYPNALFLLEHTSLDFSKDWQYFCVSLLNLPTIPSLPPKKLNEYIYTYFDFIGYGLSFDKA